ncbi:MAG: SidE phosphodiesterase domain-containing protein [Gammaproteobacteria bacterium]|nr:SidE phosphodiesterase domain-containing protein [Gammaproteobacteria bacterium]
MKESVKLAIRYVHHLFLSKPYSDTASNRGSYIDQNGRHQNYPKFETPLENPSAVFRPNHGTAHTIRVVSKVPDVCDGLSDDEMDKLQIACAFYVAGRESEISFNTSSHIYRQYRQKSADLFYDYAKALRTDNADLLFSEAELQIYKEAVNNPYAKNDEADSLSRIKNILYSCHALDLARCQTKKEMAKEKLTLDPALFIKSEIQQILTGDSRKSSVDEKEGVADTPIRKRMRLFILASTNPDLCFRLVALSEKIKTAEQANSVAILLNYYAIKSVNEFETCLHRIENAAEIDPILLEVDIISKNTSAGRIIKTIRQDDRCFWPDITKSLCNPAGHRPELRSHGRGKFTNRLNNGTYEVVSTDKSQRPSLHGDQKLEYAKHQSCSYVNYDVGYDSPYFGYHSDRADLIVGVSFDIKDCLFQRIMLYDGGTVLRTYDGKTKEKAEQYLDRKLQEKRYHTSIADLQETGLAENKDEINEVMAGFKWNVDGSSHITVFTDNLESRLLAQARAISLQNQLRKQFSNETIIVPISIYPDFSIYNEAEKKQDLANASKQNRSHYLDVMKLLSTDTIKKPNDAQNFILVYDLLSKVEPRAALHYFDLHFKTICFSAETSLCLITSAGAAMKNNHALTANTLINKALELEQIKNLCHYGHNAPRIQNIAQLTKIATAALQSHDLETIKTLFANIKQQINIHGNKFNYDYCIRTAFFNCVKNAIHFNADIALHLANELEPSDENKLLITEACANVFIKNEIDFFQALLKKTSAAAVFCYCTQSDHYFECTKFFIENDTINQDDVTNALKRDPGPKTSRFLCNLVTESMPNSCLTTTYIGIFKIETARCHSALGVIGALEERFSFLRSPLTCLKQSLIQALLDYINALGKITNENGKFELGFFSKKTQNPKLCEKKVAHARALIKNIGSCENETDIKFFLTKAALDNTIQFELFRTSGKSRYATCLETLIGVVSNEIKQNQVHRYN